MLVKGRSTNMRFSGLNPTLLTRKYADEKSNDDNFLKYLQFFKTKNQFLILKGGWHGGGQTSLQEEAGAQVAKVTHKNKNEKSNFALVGN